jgi:hypothetical protein
MRVMVIIKANSDSEAGVMPSTELLEQMTAYNEDLVNAGIMLSGEGLQPSSQSKRLHFTGKDARVIDGPFAETKELIAGFWIWQVDSMEQAIEWARRCPNPDNEEFDLDIRPIGEVEDFGEELTPELRAREDAMRTRLEANQ